MHRAETAWQVCQKGFRYFFGDFHAPSDIGIVNCMEIETQDKELLQHYVVNGSEDAFRRLMERYYGQVQSMARRQTGDPHLAQDVAQAVFLILSRKAASLPAGTILAGWFFKTTRFVASTAMRTERRRRARESNAMQMNASCDACSTLWDQVQPFVDDGMAALRDKDREAVLLRYFRQQSVQEVAEALQLSEDAAEKRIARAVERLRRYMQRRGILVSSVALLAAFSAHAEEVSALGPGEWAGVGSLSGNASAAELAAAAMKSMAILPWMVPLSAVAGGILPVAVGLALFLPGEGSAKRVRHDLVADFSLASNPNGVWSYGWLSRIDGPFTPLSYRRSRQVAEQVVLESWQLGPVTEPAVMRNVGTVSWYNGQGTFPPGCVWFNAVPTGQPQNLTAIRFKVPAGGGGSHQVLGWVEPTYDARFAGDSDFHVVTNGVEAFVRQLDERTGVGFTNLFHLKEGDTVDFVIGRGLDGVGYASSLKIQATIWAERGDVR